MKKIITILSLVLLFLAGNIFALDSTGAKNQYRKGNTNKVGFIDADGDGYNDNAADRDGDGIPNGMDDDYTGAKNRKGNGSRGFVDADGDGVNDNAQDVDGDGIPNGKDDDFVRTKEGYGNKKGSGNCGGNGQSNGRGGNK